MKMKLTQVLKFKDGTEERFFTDGKGLFDQQGNRVGAPPEPKQTIITELLKLAETYNVGELK